MLEDIKKPAEDLAKETGEYVDMKIADAKLKITEGLSVGLGRLCSIAVILIFLSIVLISIEFAVILLVGELLKSYLLGAIIVSAVFLLLFIIMVLCRKKMFVNSFVRMFVKIFFEEK